MTEINRLTFSSKEIDFSRSRYLAEERIAALTGIPAELLNLGYETSDPMAKTNVATKKAPIFTHEGAKASHINPAQQLRRLVMAHMLWEDQFYIDGKSAAEQVAEAVKNVKAELVSEIAIEAREKQKLRHIPLFICRVMAGLPTHKHVVADTLARVIQRADELAEYVALYFKDGRQPLSAQSKKGLARAFQKFDEYQLAKYNRDGVVKLKDVAALAHFKPKEGVEGYTKALRKEGQVPELPEGSDMLDRLMRGDLKTPDTWEVSLSSGADKNESFERLILGGKLGGMALLRNLRNMKEAGTSKQLIAEALQNANLSRILPFRFIAAARAVPEYEDIIEPAMLRAAETLPKLRGKTCLVVDNSGSMYGAKVSAKSEIDRSDAACALAILAREVCEEVVILSFSDTPALVPTRRGFALADAVKRAVMPSATMTDFALDAAARYRYDRIIVITDEQSHQRIRAPLPGTKAYFINVASYQNGIGCGQWTHIDGWSEAVLDYIRISEEPTANEQWSPPEVM